MLPSLLIAAAARAALLTGAQALALQAAPASEGFSSERLARSSPVMRAEIDKGTMPGAVTLIARHGQVVHVEAPGYRDSGTAQPMTTAAVVRLFSMTKPCVSGMAMRRVEQGPMPLSDAISTWLPARKEADTKAAIEARESDVSPDETGPQLAAIPRAWQPGTRGPYGVSTDVRGILRERMTGQRLDRLRDERLFTPLPMQDTSVQVQPDQRTRLADSTGDAM